MIVLDTLRKSFGSRPVLRGVSLRVPKGHSMVVIGPSGAGKSIMLKCAIGLTQPDSGTVTLANTLITPASRARLMPQTGVLFQGAALFDSLPIWENVAFTLLRQMSRARARAAAIEKLARVGLSADVADRLPSELSGGMRKRAGLARAIANEPQLMFFDEPTTGLDPVMAGKINRLIREVVTELGATALTITHDITTVQTVADDVAFLCEGKVRWTGEAATLNETEDPKLRAFLAGRSEDE